MSAPTRPTAPPRRSFLAALTGAMVAAPVVAAPAIAAKIEPAESPELLALGEQLQARLAAYRKAAARKVAAVAHYQRVRPAVPDELIVSEADVDYREQQLSRVEYDPIEGRATEPYRCIYYWRDIQIHIIGRDVPANTKRGRQLRRLVRLAKKHEAGMDAAIREAGYHEAEEAARIAAGNVCDLAVPLLDHTPAGPIGLSIFAQALLAAKDVECDLFKESPTYFAALGVHIAKALTEHHEQL